MPLMTPKRSQDHYHTCKHCLQGFYSSRYDAKLCSAKCRKAASRDASKVYAEATKINNALDHYIAMYVQANKMTRATAVDLLDHIAHRASEAANVWRE